MSKRGVEVVVQRLEVSLGRRKHSPRLFSGARRGILKTWSSRCLAEAEGSRVIVTWVHPAEPIDLRERGITESQAADLRRRLAPFAEDWDRPEMAAYDELPPR